MTRPTGPAWERLLASTRAGEHGAQLFRDAYEAGREDERRGRLSRARYRREIEAMVHSWENGARDLGHRAMIYATKHPHPDEAARCERQAELWTRAARRARAILVSLGC